MQKFWEDRVQLERDFVELNVPMTLSTRSRNALAADGIATVSMLLRYEESDLLSIPNIGRRSVAEIKVAQVALREAKQLRSTTNVKLVKFEGYEIRQVIDWKENGGVVEVMPLSELTSTDIPTDAKPYWSLYGKIQNEGVDCIADRETYSEIRTLYFAITGIDCGEDEADHFKLPT